MPRRAPTQQELVAMMKAMVGFYFLEALEAPENADDNAATEAVIRRLQDEGVDISPDVVRAMILEILVETGAQGAE